MLAQVPIGLQSFSDKIKKFTGTAFKIGSQERYELVTGVRMNPNTVLESNHTCPSEESAQPITY